LLAPAFAARIAGPIAQGATVLLGIAVLMILFKAWPAAWAMIGSGRAIALAAFVVIGLIVGHLLGGPAPEDRTVLALSTASRHPGMALAIAQTLFPQHHPLVMGGLVLYLLASAVLSIPYLIWRRRQPVGAAGMSRQ
jgi:BASS family bile acid:Na+ symporter